MANSAHCSNRSTSGAFQLPEFEVVFDEDNEGHPRRWPLAYRCWTIFVISFSFWVVVLYSTSYTSAIPGLVAEFESSTLEATLGVTAYLLGFASGSLVLAPLSELYGRRIVYVVCLSIWALLVIPCALARTLWILVILRYLW